MTDAFRAENRTNLEIALMGKLLGSSHSLQPPTRHWFVFLAFAGWLAVVLALIAQHAMWRDEVRALSLALTGTDLVSMLQVACGDGHPALWYLMLRAAHSVVGRPEVLPVVALIVAIAAALLLVLKAPFPWPVICLILVGHFFLFEYSVMARNYGISMLVLFAIATLYPACRSRGIVLGVMLFLLANCNVHSVILVGGFLSFWLTDILHETGLRWSQSLTNFVLNAVIAVLGVVVCVLMIYPPTWNDAAVPHWPGGIRLDTLVADIFNPARNFRGFLLPRTFYQTPWSPFIEATTSLLLFGSTLGLVRRPGAFLAAFGTLIAFSLFFAFVHPGSYRHYAVWLSFLISLYWICWDTPRWMKVEKPTTLRKAAVTRVGSVMFILLLGIQGVGGFLDVKHAVFGDDLPRSRSADFAAFLAGRPDLRDAVLIADPDLLLEPLPYYLDNKTYLMREQRYGSVVAFTKKARLNLGLDDILQAARTIHETSGKPVVILLLQELDGTAERNYSESIWTLTTTPAQVRSFLNATSLLHRFRPAQDEAFDAYLLK